MFQVYGRQDVSIGIESRRMMSIFLWLAISTGLAVSIFSLIEELCLATACSDAASFTFFGVGMGWFGVAYFSLILMLLWLRQKVYFFNLALVALVFAGIGAEFHLLWIQKYIIGSWCPICVTICCALFTAAALLLVDIIQNTAPERGSGKILFGWLVLLMVMMAIGLAVAVVGLRALI